MKSKTQILFFAALVLGAYCCSSKGDGSVSEVIVNGDKVYVFSLNDLKSDTTILPLSSLVEDCALVQLESNEDAYVDPWFTTVTDKYIGVRQRSNKPYMLFDRSGKFLCKVGSIGGGPGEYTISLYDDIIDEKNELVYLASMSSDKILVYNTSGEFLKDIIAPHRLKKPKMFLSNDVLTVVHMPFSDDRAVAIQFDVNTGEILKELIPPSHLIVQNFNGEIFNTRNAPGIFDFLHTSSDTLYHFDVKNNKILPAFMMTFDSSEKPYKQYYQLNKDMLLTFIFGKGLVTTDLKNKTSSWINVVNDYYGNMPAPTYIVQLRDGYWVHNLQTEQLMEDIENRLAKRDCTENDKQILNKTLSTLEEGANNVVFIGKLKSEVKTKLW
ncbi:6-bladed beta-propeller [Proteiniphilum acetatigenes]|uniref:6-bladed beta-propeller n=1 Tax=Proteiniphilum acetatigenes TaxID=294710 RepID=UPI00036A779C|nr:6-bladed beta-propeller [Proteiniphilum acetatigenes]SFK43037.1 6-bladed beta-propeller protein [Porphyromonadaceae bacterium KH3CP3RA]